MSNLTEYFSTDWAAMTLHDWIGLSMTIMVFIVMLVLYVYVFHPSNKEHLEAQRYMPMDEDFMDSEKTNERRK